MTSPILSGPPLCTCNSSLRSIVPSTLLAGRLFYAGGGPALVTRGPGRDTPGRTEAGRTLHRTTVVQAASRTARTFQARPRRENVRTQRLSAGSGVKPAQNKARSQIRAYRNRQRGGTFVAIIRRTIRATRSCDPPILNTSGLIAYPSQVSIEALGRGKCARSPGLGRATRPADAIRHLRDCLVQKRKSSACVNHDRPTKLSLRRRTNA